MLSSLPADRPTNEYDHDSKRSTELRTAVVNRTSVAELVDPYLLITERQAGYLLAIRDRMIREETTRGSSILGNEAGA